MATLKTSTHQLSWEARKGKLRAKFPQLTEADLNFEENQWLNMLTKLQVKTGRTARELQMIMEK
jgi:hypothetical protein